MLRPICQCCFAIVKVLLKKVTYLLTYLCYSLHMAVNDVAGEWVYHDIYEIFIVYILGIILCPVYPKNLDHLKKL